MRQYRITSADILPQSSDDCYISPDDPIHELMKPSLLGGLGSDQALHQYLQSSVPTVQGSDKGRIARENNIKPGTDEWFKHFFSNQPLTEIPSRARNKK